MAGFQFPEQLFHEKHYLSRDNSVRVVATSSMHETLIQKSGLWLLAITGLIKPPSQLK